MDNLMDQRKLGMLAGLLVLMGVGIYFYQQVTEKKDQEGKTALYKVQKTFEEENTALPEADRAAGVTLDVDAKFSKTVAELNGMLNSKAASSRVLYEAGVKLASLYLDHGQADKSIDSLKKVVSFSNSSFQKASAYFLLGTAEERAQKFDDAFKTYESGLSQNIDGLKGE